MCDPIDSDNPYPCPTLLGPILKETEWKNKLHILTPDDVRPRPRATFSDPEHKKRKKKKKRLDGARATAEIRKKAEEERPASWIWCSQLSNAEGSQMGMVEALKIEWARARARAWRWMEEVDLVEEEMRWVLEFLDWKAEWWLGLKDQRPAVVEDLILNEGFTAHAWQQSEIQRDLRVHFQGNWQSIPTFIETARAGLGKIPTEEEQEEEDGEDGDKEPGGPIPEVARDSRVVASFMEESLA